MANTKSKKLNPKQKRFCQEYIVDCNATQAAIRAGYSERTAGSQGQRLLKKVEIQEEIARQQKRVADKLDITAERVLRELALLGFANMEDYIQTQEDGSAYVDLSELTREQAAAIQEITVDEYMEGGGEEARPVKKVKFKLADKRAALVDLGRHLRLFGGDGADKEKESVRIIIERVSADQSQNNPA